MTHALIEKFPTGLMASLAEAMQTWMNEVCEDEGWDRLDTYLAENTNVLMAEAASGILLAQANLSIYLREDSHDV